MNLIKLELKLETTATCTLRRNSAEQTPYVRHAQDAALTKTGTNIIKAIHCSFWHLTSTEKQKAAVNEDTLNFKCEGLDLR